MKATQPAAPPAKASAAPRVPPLRERRECARFVALLIRAGYRDEMPLDKVRTLTYAAQTLANMYTADDLEARLATLEAEARAIR